jgi:hypothetical protein
VEVPVTNRLSQKGQATVEAIGASLLILAFITTLLLCSYFGFLKIFSEYLLHEALVCADTISLSVPQENCQRKLERQLKKILLFQKVENIQWKKSKKSISLSLQLSGWKNQFTPAFDLKGWTLRKSLALPLQH